MAHIKSPLPALDAPADQKIEFFLTASHQLKSPVAIIQWCLQSVMEMPASDETSMMMRKLSSRALQQADDMSRLIGDMLQVFRLMTGKDQGVAEPIEPTPLIQEIFEQYKTVAHEKKVHLVKGAIENLPTIYGKGVLLRQAIVNLIDNAIKYTKPGKKVTVAAETHKGSIEIKISDEGIGISDLELHRLFTEFFRGEEAKDTASGTGLGLVLVKHIAETFGGEVTVKSRLHHGSTFTIHIPYSDK